MAVEIFGAGIFPLITCICSVILGTYIYFLNHEHIANKIFILFMVCMAIASFLDFFQAISTIENLALILAKLKYAIMILVPIFFLHLSSVLSDNEKIISTVKYIIIPYVLSIIFFIIIVATDLIITGVTFENNTYSTNLGILNPLLMAFAFLMLVPGLIILIITFKNTKNNDKKMQMTYIFTGITISALLFLTFHEIIPRIFGIDIPGAIIFTLPLFIFFALAIAKHKLMVMPKLVHEIDISAEPIDYELESGYTYIIPEKEPKLGFQLFAKSLKEGAHGICITMRDPRNIRRKYGLKKTPIIWITDKEISEFTVKPDEITYISEILKPFFERSEDSVIFLIDDKTITSGLNYEDHSEVLKLSKNFFDGVVKSNSKFIISVAPGSISPKKRLPIIKTKTPLLEFTRLAAFMFEEICNNVIQFLIRNAYIKQEDIPEHLTNLSKKDRFFKSLRYRRSHNPVTTNSKIKFTNILVAQRLSKQILIDKVRLFVSEFESIKTATNLNSIAINSIREFGLSHNEFLLHPGDAYIIPDNDPQRAFSIFSEFLSKDFDGLCITKSNPKKIKRKFGLTRKGTKVYWLTEFTEANQDILPPKLEHILSTIEDFLAKRRNKKIILLDGVEYLITYSGDNFEPVLGFLRQVTDMISETNGLIIIPLNPMIISDKRIGILLRSGMELYK
jgi:hypothetical protein